MRDDFALLILSHGRADSVRTVDAFKDADYTGKWYIVIDNEDKQAEKYYENFGKDHVVMFDKASYDGKFDIMDNFEGRGVPTYARNAFFDIAKDLGLKYFVMCEDDHEKILARRLVNGVFVTIYVHNLDPIIDNVLEFLETSGATSITFAETGDFIGGANNVYKKGLTRKAMTSFFCKTDNRFEFLGRFNDDVNTYVEHGKRGKLFFTMSNINIHTAETQIQEGGLTANYLKYGTYTKSFYSVMLNPSAVWISEMGQYHKRIHHAIDWNKAVPVIISDRYKKKWGINKWKLVFILWLLIFFM